MTGTRTTLFLLILALAVASIPPTQQQPMLFDFIEVEPSLAIMAREVTISEWRQCYTDHACSYMPKLGLGASDDEFPVTEINWFDIEEFVTWAKIRSGLNVRLPTADEWQRASGLHSPKLKPLFTDPRLAWAADYSTAAKIDPILHHAGYFGSSSNRIVDFSGNVWEWTASCASAGFTGADAEFCPAYKVMGEHAATVSVFVRDPATGGCAAGTPPAHIGLRLAVSLD